MCDVQSYLGLTWGKKVINLILAPKFIEWKRYCCKMGFIFRKNFVIISRLGYATIFFFILSLENKYNWQVFMLFKK